MWARNRARMRSWRTPSNCVKWSTSRRSERCTGTTRRGSTFQPEETRQSRSGSGRGGRPMGILGPLARGRPELGLHRPGSSPNPSDMEPLESGPAKRTRSERPCPRFRGSVVDPSLIPLLGTDAGDSLVREVGFHPRSQSAPLRVGTPRLDTGRRHAVTASAIRHSTVTSPIDLDDDTRMSFLRDERVDRQIRSVASR